MPRLFTLRFLLPFLFVFSLAYANAAPAHQFLWLSDLHFDPTADPSLVDKLAAAPIHEWRDILGAASSQPISPLGQDSNWALFSSALARAAQQSPDVSFVVITGDVLAHNLQKKFEKASSQGGDTAFQDFAAKTAEFVADQLQQAARGKPVFWTPGNNDDSCGDYQSQPNGPFLKATAGATLRLLGSVGERSVEDTWSSLGNYSARLPGIGRGRIISFNSSYFSPRYQDSCTQGATADRGKQELGWLETQLVEAKKNHERVWLAFHIPPGVDGYATSKAEESRSPNPVFLWKPEYTQAFERLLQIYQHTVVAMLAGHEHMDDFRVIGKSPVLLCPAVSPISGQNPAFRTATFRADGRIEDEVTFYLANTPAKDTSAATGVDPAVPLSAPEWKMEYRFRDAWGVKRIDWSALEGLYQRIETRSSDQHLWTTLYAVSQQQNADAQQRRFVPLFCAARFADEDAFQRCDSKKVQAAVGP